MTKQLTILRVFMKRTNNYSQENSATDRALERCRHACDAIRHAMVRAKERVLNEYAHLAEENLRVLRLALNEAEALAWQTDYPHLFFPTLAVEKAQAAVAWHRRQRVVRRAAAELAFAE